MRLRAYVLMVLVVAVWGSTFVLIKGALADATPATFNLVRMTLAFAVLAVVYPKLLAVVSEDLRVVGESASRPLGTGTASRGGPETTGTTTPGTVHVAGRASISTRNSPPVIGPFCTDPAVLPAFRKLQNKNSQRPHYR